MKKAFYIVTALVLVSGCSLGKRTPVSIYSLTKSEVVPHGCKLEKSIEIAEPTAGSGIASRRIAVLESTGKFNYYNGVRWAAAVPEMVQGVMVNSFEKSTAFKSVSTDMEAAATDIILITDIRNYEVTGATEPKIKISLVSKLLESGTRKILATIPVEKEVSPQANKMENIVEIFNAATNEAANEVTSKAIAALKDKGCK